MQNIGGITYSVFIIESRKGSRSVIGIASSVRIDELRALLESKDVKVTGTNQIFTPADALKQRC